jgi:hypothetical protein
MKKIFVVVLSLAMSCTACSTAWVSTLDSILAAAAPALINILQIVAVANGQSVNSGLTAKINTDAAVIKTLAGDFAMASSLAAPGVCSQLQVAVNTYQADQTLYYRRPRSATRICRQKLPCSRTWWAEL